jgi:hypothetical protein
VKPEHLALALRVKTGLPFQPDAIHPGAVHFCPRTGETFLRVWPDDGCYVVQAFIASEQRSVAKSLDEVPDLIGTTLARSMSREHHGVTVVADALAKDIDQRVAERLLGRGARVDRLEDLGDGFLTYDIVGVGTCRLRRSDSGRSVTSAEFMPDATDKFEAEKDLGGMTPEQAADWIAWRAVAPRIKG